MGKKQLNEAIQALEGKISQQNLIIQGLSTDLIPNFGNKVNPFIKNSNSYNTVLGVADRIQATNRYIFDIPDLYLPSNRLETLFYLYGSLCFYKEDGRLYVAMYSKEGELNKLGDLTIVSPIDFAGIKHRQRLTVVYNDDVVLNPCVIINDYTGTYLESNIIPRANINGVSINDQSTVYNIMKNTVKLTAKKAIAVMNDKRQQAAIAQSINNVFESNNPVITLVGESLEEVFKMFNLDTKLDIEGYTQAIKTYECLRANFNGVKTPPSAGKRERLITDEIKNEDALTKVYLYDGLVNRQIGLELMKKHGLCSSGSVKINPTFEEEKTDGNTVDTRSI